ncbi:hypothetical protein ETB97_000386 [Aspergillus alliaceus]|uniref:HpcH/HpaI aldolase/citrate lyase domain-containing protein n=1 Tax=Petromyces alliaceus TaxID=209559 RepID=A0A8H6A712_PETAA|nr:hypothetical protein ETB97_000386 [Aspergillus burnettii]
MAVGCNDSDCLNNSATDHKHGDMRDYIAPSLFQPHRVRLAIRDAHEKKIPPLIGYYAGPPAVSITHWLTPMGFDYVWIDWEYNATNIETMTTTAFMSSAKTIPFVRVPGHDAFIIGYALNTGASIIVPHVDMVEEAKHVVSAVKLDRKQNGTRSTPPFRYTALMIQIESLEGIHNLDAILTKVPEIDIVWFGTIDARMNLAMFPDGDQTEIGERGNTISGGQKQRLNIGRANYSGSDIVLMDKAICGLLKPRCGALATHQLHVLGCCDRNILMDEGHIVAIDIFANLMRTDQLFQTLMLAKPRQGDSN